jgi:hypothetical protein
MWVKSVVFARSLRSPFSDALQRQDGHRARSPSISGRTNFDKQPPASYDDIDRALGAYNTVRQPLSKRIVSHGRKLGMQLGVGITTDEDRSFAKLLQTPKGILDWIGIPNFLDARPKIGVSPAAAYQNWLGRN